tara:strand:- start:2842 stop:4005 length:1164 start_codon:yes stop_codon:yes gene_type:complete
MAHLTDPVPPSPAFGPADHAWMRAALALAKRGLGRVAPNPAVGCIFVRPDLGDPLCGGRVVGRGWTQPGGRPHAEAETLAQAGALSKGAHAYVTLEPCSHQGKTAPCADALISAGVTHVTVAMIDPDPRVSGSGVARLKDAGINVRTGLLSDAARVVNAGFLSTIERARPWLTMKTATALDGTIAARTGESQWITGPAARRRGHLLRAENDVILTGIGTVLADNPTLTCRLAGLEDRSPIRVVVDPRAETPVPSKLTESIDMAPLWVVTGPDAPEGKRNDLRSVGAEVISLPGSTGGRLNPGVILQTLAERGITRVLLEAGGSLNASFMAADLVDELAWFRAPSVIGADGTPAIAPMAVNSPATAPRFHRVATIDLDDDVLERYLRG